LGTINGFHSLRIETPEQILAIGARGFWNSRPRFNGRRSLPRSPGGFKIQNGAHLNWFLTSLGVTEAFGPFPLSLGALEDVSAQEEIGKRPEVEVEQPWEVSVEVLKRSALEDVSASSLTLMGCLMHVRTSGACRGRELGATSFRLCFGNRVFRP